MYFWKSSSPLILPLPSLPLKFLFWTHTHTHTHTHISIREWGMDIVWDIHFPPTSTSAQNLFHTKSRIIKLMQGYTVFSFFFFSKNLTEMRWRTTVRGKSVPHRVDNLEVKEARWAATSKLHERRHKSSVENHTTKKEKTVYPCINLTMMLLIDTKNSLRIQSKRRQGEKALCSLDNGFCLSSSVCFFWGGFCGRWIFPQFWDNPNLIQVYFQLLWEII